MQIRTILIAVLLIVATGPALATGTVAAGQTGADTPSTTAAQSSFDCEYPIEVEDATGETVEIEEEPEDVVVLYPNVAQHMWEIGAQEKVIGMPVNNNTAYLEGSEDREHVLTEGEQGFDVPNTELIVDLEPDLVLSPNVTPEPAVEELRSAGLTVFHYPIAGNFEDVMTLVERTGQLVGSCEEAAEVTDDMAERIEAVEQATADVDEPRVFYDLGGGYTVNADAFEHNVLTSAGADNIAADVEAEFGGAYPQVSAETVLDRDPEYVITTDTAPLSDFAGYEDTTALQNDQVIEVNANYISQHAPRTVIVLETIAEQLHPEAMQDANQADDDPGGADDEDTDDGDANQDDDTTADDEEDDTTADDEGDDTDADDEDGTDDDDTAGDDADGPGLTVGAAVVALVALALIATRRR